MTCWTQDLDINGVILSIKLLLSYHKARKVRKNSVEPLRKLEVIYSWMLCVYEFKVSQKTQSVVGGGVPDDIRKLSQTANHHN